MIQQNTDDERFITKVKLSKIKKDCIVNELTRIIRSQKYFTNEDIDMDDSCYANWNSYEVKLIRIFLAENTFSYKLGELLDEDLISDSPYTRRKLIYSRYSKTELLNHKRAEERKKRIAKLLGNEQQDFIS